MHVVLLGLVVVIAAFGVACIALRRAQRRIPPLILAPGESVPSTALQRLAGWTLAICAVLTSAAAGIVGVKGAQVFSDADGVRLTVTGLLIASVGVFAVYLGRVARWMAREDSSLDERDVAILSAAPAGQAPAMLVTLAAWSVALSTTYHDTGLVPSVFLYLMFWSCLMVSALALLAGVVTGYRR